VGALFAQREWESLVFGGGKGEVFFIFGGWGGAQRARLWRNVVFEVNWTQVGSRNCDSAGLIGARRLGPFSNAGHKKKRRRSKARRVGRGDLRFWDLRFRGENGIGFVGVF